MKSILFFTLVLVSSVISRADGDAVPESSSPSLYCRIGGGVSDVFGAFGHHRHDFFYDFDDSYSSSSTQQRQSIHAGVGVSIPLWSWLSFKTELNYSPKGVSAFQSRNEWSAETIRHELSSSYAEVPVLVSFNVPSSGLIRGSLYMGGYAAYMLNGTHRQAVVDPVVDTLITQLPDETATSLQRFDAGAVIGISVGFKVAGFLLFADARVSHGVLPVWDGRRGSVNRKAEVSLGLAL